MRLRSYLVLGLIATSTVFIGCASEESDAATRGETPTDAVTRGETPHVDTSAIVATPAVETVPDSVLEKNANCPFLGTWRPIAIEGKELDVNQKKMTLTFHQSGVCETYAVGNTYKGQWESSDWVTVSIKDPSGPDQEMEIQSIENDQMVFISNGLDKITVAKVIETPTE